MFKLIKIEGSGTNQPEPIRVIADPSVNFKSGFAYTLVQGVLTRSDPYTRPTHVAIESMSEGERSSLLCFRIHDNMIFEVPTNGSPSYFEPGYNYVLDVDADGAGKGLEADGERGVVMFYDMNGAINDGDTVLVRVTPEENY